MQLTCLTCDSGTEIAGEQGDYYDPLFTHWEGDEASYFVVSEDSKGGAADVGPSGVSSEKESPAASGSGEQFAEPVTSEREPDIAPATEVARTDEVLPTALMPLLLLPRFLLWNLFESAPSSREPRGTLSLRRLG